MSRAIRRTLAFSLCGVGECSKAIPLLKQAADLAENSFGPESLSTGVGQYLLGYAYWQNGNMDEAAGWMERGTTRLKADLAWGHPVYVDAMRQYARFLEERGQTEAATDARRQVRPAESVVDAQALTGRPAEVDATRQQ